jgi:4a-hydroxytetrahydrobiopterin dehydratase
MMISLTDRNCQHRSENDPKLSKEQITRWLAEIDSWEIINTGTYESLEKSFSLPDFSEGIKFAAAIAELANAQDHHPEIVISWGKVNVRWWTHTVKGLSENDFIMAAKIDKLPFGHSNK